MTDEGLIQIRPAPRLFHRIVLKKNIALSQRIEHFLLEISEGGRWKKIAEGTAVGSKRIVSPGPVRTDALRVIIDDARVRPTLSFLGVYAEREDSAGTGS